ncbi:glycine N-acyltransferase-like protein 3 [Hemicordylus capensis]|uniref:glycine N-acyltransferase-like protein 3 n=1 Tax=Hemicordylus capensis TaxID=884348 RepID=UPI002303F4B6|nr:glycine N-acyltransferase-like protein 3 [Hemicordylus capensis]
MLILSCPSKLQLLEGVLRRSLPQTLTVYGAVMHINRGNPAQHEVVVDSWPEFKVVLTRPQKEVVKDNRDFYASLYAAFYWEIDACRSLLENAKVIDWGKAFQLQGLQDGLYEVARSTAEARDVHFEPYYYETVLHPGPPAHSQSRPRSDFLHFGTLNSSHAALLNETWSTGGNCHSLNYMDSLIRDFPSACLIDKEGQLASWCLSDAAACLTHTYTLPKYRGQGCMETVVQATARKLYANGFPIYGGVLRDNNPSRQSLKRQGFHFLPWTHYVIFVKPAIRYKE